MVNQVILQQGMPGLPSLTTLSDVRNTCWLGKAPISWYWCMELWRLKRMEW